MDLQISAGIIIMFVMVVSLLGIGIHMFCIDYRVEKIPKPKKKLK